MKALFFKLIISSALITTVTGCKKDFDNPNAVQDDLAFSSPRAVTATAIGLQRTYSFSRAGSIYSIITANGFVTNELILLNTGNVPETQLNTGGNTVDGSNNILANIWANANKIIFDADKVIAAAKRLPGNNDYSVGLIGYASIYKALALGSLAMNWEKVPDSVGANVSFSGRETGFNKAITTLSAAIDTIQITPVSPLFAGYIIGGTDILNTLYALRARYALYVGNYALALSSANAVDLTKKSTMNFDAVSINPIYETATSTNNVFQPVDSTFGLPIGQRPSLSDKRVQFYTTINTAALPRFRVGGFGIATTTGWPYYLPGEMTLIKAEVYVRQTGPNLPNAIVEINKIRTKKAADDPFGIGADESVYVGSITEQALLDEIYRQRCIEMFMSGLKLEDMRRFGRPNSERKRNFFPYPLREKENNPNTPDNPVF